MRTILIVPWLALMLCGCSAEKDSSVSTRGPTRSETRAGMNAEGFSEAMMGGPKPKPPGMGGEMALVQLDAAKAPPAPVNPVVPLPRKIIRDASIKIIVSDFAEAEQKLRILLGSQPDAYLAKAEISGSPGAPRSGMWIIRVPIAALDSFIDGLLKLGVPQKNSVDSKDVTEEYYDVQARIKNKKVEEERLVKHLEKSTGKLEEILKVEAEISRVRGEIEQMEGRLRLLANLSELTTIQEIKDYVPPQAPTFTSNIGSTFLNSYELVVGFGKNLVLVVAALVPWLPLMAIVVIPLWYFLRKQVNAPQGQA
jgi:Domain of unknown function (DUF4349)